MIVSPVIGNGKGVPGVLMTLWPLLGRPVALHRGLVEWCGGVKTALLLSQAIYWTRKGVAIAETDGWFFKRMEDWRVETGLGRRSQARARRRLIALGVMEERLQGIPAHLEFRINLECLAERLATHHLNDTVPSAHLTSILGAPLAFHASLAAMTCSVTAGLLLSSILHLSRRRLLEVGGTASAVPWITLPVARWLANTGLSRREFDHARQILLALSLIEEQLRGIPPQLHMRVQIIALTRQLSQKTHEKMLAEPNLYVLDNQVCGMPAICVAETAHPSLSKTVKLDCPERANQVVQNVHDSLAENAKTSMGLTTALLQPPTQIETVTQATTGRGGKDHPLIYPNNLTAPEKEAMGVLLMNVPQNHAQIILDELEGRLRRASATGIPNRVGYVRRLRDLYFGGGFVPEVALAVRAGRLQRAEEAQRRVAEAQARARENAMAEMPEAKEKREQALAQVKAMLNVPKAERSSV